LASYGQEVADLALNDVGEMNVQAGAEHGVDVGSGEEAQNLRFEEDQLEPINRTEEVAYGRVRYCLFP
jgi:hypothetical protein